MGKNENTPSTTKANFTRLLVWIALFLLGLWICWPAIVSWWSTPNNDETAIVTYSDIGSFGDLFGCYNALVSMLAFIGFLVALQLQRRELKLQRDEMERNREVSEKQAKAYEDQNKLITIQLEHARAQSTHQTFWNIYSILERNYSEFEIKRKGYDFLRSLVILKKLYIKQRIGINTVYFRPNEEYRKFIDSYYDLKSLFVKTICLIEIHALGPTMNVLNTDGKRKSKNVKVEYMKKIISSLGAKDTKRAMGYFICLFEHSEYASSKSLELFYKYTNVPREKDMLNNIEKMFQADIRNYNSQQAEEDRLSVDELIKSFTQIIKDGKTASILK